MGTERCKLAVPCRENQGRPMKAAMKPRYLSLYAMGLLGLLLWGLSESDISRSIDPEDLGDSTPAKSSLIQGAPSSARLEAAEFDNVGQGPTRSPAICMGTAFVQRTPQAPLQEIAEGSIVLESAEALHVVPIVNGVWTFPSTNALDGEVNVLEIWESGTKLRSFQESRVPGGEQERLVAFAYPGFFAVLIGADGAPASRSTVLRSPHGLRESSESIRRHPGNPRTLVRVRPYQTSAWIYLPSLPPNASGYWVNTPGAEWNLITAAMTNREDPLQLDFKLGCSLQIAIDGFAETRGLRLYIMQAGRVISRYDQLVGEEPFQFSGLPTGATEVMLSFDDTALQSTAIALSEIVQLSAGASSEVSLIMPPLGNSLALQGEIKGILSVDSPELWSDLKDFEELAVILNQDPVTPGFLALPKPAKDVPVSLMHKLLDTASEVSWEWSLSGIPEGTYTIKSYPIGPEEEIVVRAGETSTAFLSIPMVARTVIDVFQEGEVRPDALVFNTSSRAEPARGGLNLTPSKKLGESTFTLVTMPGEVSVFVVVPGLASASKEFTVLPGWNSVQVDMPVAFGFELVAVDSHGKWVPFASWFDLGINAVNGSGTLISSSVGHELEPESGVILDIGRFFVSEPGEYEISWPLASSSPPGLPRVIQVADSPDPDRHQIRVLSSDL